MRNLFDSLQRNGTPVLAVIGFIGIWQLLVTIFKVPTWLLPAPTVIWFELTKGMHLLKNHIIATGAGAVGGLLIGSVCGIVLATLMVQFRILGRILMPLLVVDQSVPKLALAPIFVIWFGAGMMTRIFIAMVISFFPIVVNTARGMTTIDVRVHNLMDTLSASRWDLLTKVQMPNAVPYIFSGLKVATPLSIIGAVVAEFMQADSGLGYVVLIAVGNVNMPMVFVAVLLMAVLSLSLFATISIIEGLLMRARFGYLAQTEEH